jgi:peptidoglycan hydrolase-like protein with peptidoglycan-binding domain
MAVRRLVPLIVVAVAGLSCAACATNQNASGSQTTGSTATSAPASTTPTSVPTTTQPPTTVPPTTAPPTTTTTTAPPPTTTTTAPKSSYLALGSTGPRVLALQQRLTALGYWVGTPNGTFGDSTQQAVYALQKASGIQRDGIVGPQTATALQKGVLPVPKPSTGYVIQVDLSDDLVMFVKDGKLQYVLNTSTGGGYTYNSGSGTAIAITPTGVFHTYREVDGIVTDSLGQLWRPKFFTGGFAIHGDSYVPPTPVSHGCVRVSNEAIDWIWSAGLDPIGTEVWVYSS